MKRLSLLIFMSFAAVLSLPLTARTLIVYYSYTNNVNRVVTELRSRIEADVLRIEPAEKGLDYAANNYAIGNAQIGAIRENPNESSSYPPIDKVNIDLSRYSTIIIGAPLWWSDMAAPMQTFLFEHGREMAGKNIGLIVSSASSGISGVEADAKRLIPDSRFLLPSLWVRSTQTSNAVTLLDDWLKAINYSTLNTPDMTDNQITIKVGETATLTATLLDNSSAEALLKLLDSGPVTINMRDYANMEKVGSLPESLPRNDEYFTAGPGDLILYLGNQFVIYYGSNSYDFTHLGKVCGDYTGPELKSILGNGNVTVTLSAVRPSGLSAVMADNRGQDDTVYNLNGIAVGGTSSALSSLSAGVYIVGGKKTLVRK